LSQEFELCLRLCLLTAEHDITASHEFAINIHLRDGGPAAVLLDAFPELWVIKAVVCPEEEEEMESR
jgi:hypothetical protein